jgi:hypothetical protein
LSYTFAGLRQRYWGEIGIKKGETAADSPEKSTGGGLGLDLV